MSLDIDVIRTRANKATPGPWTALRDQIVRDRTGETVADNLYDEETARFVAAAREDITALITEVRTLKNEMTCSMYLFAYGAHCGLAPEDCGYYVIARNVEEAVGTFILLSHDSFVEFVNADFTISLVDPNETVSIKVDHDSVTKIASELCQEHGASVLRKVPPWE